jgi:hypothetical protein
MYPDEVRAQLGVIAMAGSPELPGSLGEGQDPADSNYTLLTYDPGPQDLSTSAGKVRQKLKDLVDRTQVITIFGVGPNFLWSDGSTIEASAGGAIGDWIFYDTHNCDGDGRWVRGTDGEEVCTTSAGILFHELGHVFLDHPSGFNPEDLDQDERAAVEVENELRQAEGQVPRDPDHWPESNCGCPSDCCIVASVATGSPFSAETHALRRVRDRILRKTTTGMHLFDALHSEYYSFSVSISRLMAGSDIAREAIAAWIVRPLVQALEMAWEYVRQPNNETRLEELVRKVWESDPESPYPVWFTWQRAIEMLELAEGGQELPGPKPSLDPTLAAIYNILKEKLPHCPHVRWGIVHLLLIYLRMKGMKGLNGQQESLGALGQWLKESLDDWLSAMPFDYLKNQMTAAEMASDLRELASTIFTSPEGRRKFGAHLLLEFPGAPDSILEERMRREGYIA